MAMCGAHCSTQETWAGLWVKGQPWLHSKFEVSVGYARSCFNLLSKNKNKGKKEIGAREVAHQSLIFPVLSENPGLVSWTPIRQLTTIYNSSPRGFEASGLPGYLHCHAHIHMQTYMSTYNKKKQILKKQNQGA